ncbi:hypothetical protein DMUE_2974 [Dictyocoela muelleri]|nr:hypothetical protein DMUE_2974 [Dictyocoela muelleri]
MGKSEEKNMIENKEDLENEFENMNNKDKINIKSEDIELNDNNDNSKYKYNCCHDDIKVTCECGQTINKGLVKSLKKYFENIKPKENLPKIKISYELKPNVGELVEFFENLKQPKSD